MLFLQRKYKEAVAELEKTLAVDPEDLEAHYNLMLCYRGLNNDETASREEKLYLRFKADESSRAITGPYKLKSPADNNEAQPIHEHMSVALGERVGRKQYAEGRSQKSGVRMQYAKGGAGRRTIRRAAAPPLQAASPGGAGSR
jgi:tetratricopeptide (TPR) repeat protein